MIVFDLICDGSHGFEVWFRSSADYDDQQARGIVECPMCGTANVKKAIMAPNIAAKSNRDIIIPVLSEPEVTSTVPETTKPIEQPKLDVPKLSNETQEILSGMLDKVSKHVEENFDNVGGDFAEEARKIHYGEVAERPIYGDTTKDEAEELLDEGIDILPLPKPKRLDA